MITLSEQQQAVLNYPSTKMVIGLPCGAGKTIATLSAAKGSKRILVVMPKILKQEATWEKNQEKIGDDTQMITISKEQFKKQLHDLPACDCLILDEFGAWACGVYTTTKSANREEYIDASQIHMALMHYIAKHKPTSIYLLDATATATKPIALWATKRMLGTLSPQMSEMTSFTRFRDLFYFKYKKGYSTLYLEKKDAKTKKLLADFWKQTGVFFDTPDKIEPIVHTIPIDFTMEQNECLREISELYTDPLVLRCREFMACNGAYTRTIFDEQDHKTKKEKVVVPTDKEFWIVNFLQNTDKQVVIFATFTSQIQSITNALDACFIPSAQITGATKDKSIICDMFRKKTLRAVVIQSSICQGYEFPDCDTIIRASQPTRADHSIQQYGRIDRPHLNKKQNYIYNLIIPGTVDEEALEIIERGEDLHFMVIDENE